MNRRLPPHVRLHPVTTGRRTRVTKPSGGAFRTVVPGSDDLEFAGSDRPLAVPRAGRGALPLRNVLGLGRELASASSSSERGHPSFGPGCKPYSARECAQAISDGVVLRSRAYGHAQVYVKKRVMVVVSPGRGAQLRVDWAGATSAPTKGLTGHPATAGSGELSSACEKLWARGRRFAVKLCASSWLERSNLAVQMPWSGLRRFPPVR